MSATAGEEVAEHPVIRVEAIPDAPAALVDFGERYWALKEIDVTVTPARPLWREPTNVLAIASGFTASRSYVPAAAGVRAVAVGYECPRCGRSLTLRSRVAFTALLAGEVPDRCADCDVTLRDAVAKEVNPEADRRRRTVQQQARQRSERRTAEQAWSVAQRDYLTAHHPVRLSSRTPPSDVTVRTQVAALAMLRHAPTATPLPPIAVWPTPLAPTGVMSAELAADCFRAGLIAVHPATAPEAFVWEPPTFDEAVRAAGGDFSAIGEPVWQSFHPDRVSWYVPYGPSIGTAAENLDRYLLRGLRLADLHSTRADELLDLVVEVIAEETVRYLVFQLGEHQLPDVPDNHMPRLRDAATRLASVRSLGEGYSTAWNAARTAAANAQANPRAPKVNMTVNAVNVFEAKVQQFAADPDMPVRIYREDRRVPLSALTRTLFLTVLDADMMTCTRAQVEAMLPVRSTAEDLADLDIETTRAMLAVLDTDTFGDPQRVYAALRDEAAGSDPVITSAAQSLRLVTERARTVGHELAEALAVAVNASALLTSPVSVPDIWSGADAIVRRPVGGYLAEVMRQAARVSTSE